MPNIRIQGRDVDVDILAEIEQFPWQRPKWSGDKLIAASPFRYDKAPSFFVNLDGPYAGCWGDSGAVDDEYASGSLSKLLAFLRDETVEETIEYLLTQYDVQRTTIELKPPVLQIARSSHYVPPSLLDAYAEDYTYLLSRGIPAEVQRQYGVRYDAKRKAAVIPWYDALGRMANVKYRRTDSKIFWYEKGAIPVRESIFGIDKVFADRARTAVLGEAEVDSLSWATRGKYGIGIGGVAFTKAQADIIRRSPIERLYIAPDNDAAGEKLRESVVRELRGSVELYNVHMPTGIKDANEALMAGCLSKITVKKYERTFGLHIDRNARS